MTRKTDGFLSVKQASVFASEYLNKNVTSSNISYLIQYGLIKRYEIDKKTFIAQKDLVRYYQQYKDRRQNDYKTKLGDDLNWNLSFEHLKEKDTTKHVHRLHPYKGKFIPQLVEYFLDSHTDNFKKEVIFKEGDIILDPFCGSGTTLVQANELSMHAVGIDISSFNALISNAKIKEFDLKELDNELKKVTNSLKKYILKNSNLAFEKELLEELNAFNQQYFPSPEFKIKVRQKQINEKEYALIKEQEFNLIFKALQQKYQLKIRQDDTNSFLGQWYLEPVKKEIDFVFEELKQVKNKHFQGIISVILSRTLRSCRATTHSDLATLKEPVIKPYYCKKHGKICKPLFSIISWWERYCKDTLRRLKEFQPLRTDAVQICLQGDSRTIDIIKAIEKENEELATLVKKQKIRGIFSSPPYVGLIDYHNQHAYAYDLFNFERNDDLEIGPLFKGQGLLAKQSYIEAIAQVLNNVKQYLQIDYDIFLVANDKFNLYKEIAKKANMQIIKEYKRPVLNRTEIDKSAYAEIIFHLKEANGTK
ncbi:DNA methyltransferase [Helicobacter cetorum]|uniref:DNA methylase N-4/N-6 domain-containing protein n=1 Tax=Helicobacter cetorum (strain ATCC BAA-429 / MIT 00-7128) TaxID=182217 RepID=I0EMW9_HELC0|nr:DNA methyltransferase [Helicobacter cetorum]AFI04288.1 DNA methylase N-4/N-6 domain-containing protein [Helicobacter cetorum MIT 00-7128]